MDGPHFPSPLQTSTESAAVYKILPQMAPHEQSQEDSLYCLPLQGVDENILILIFPIKFSQSVSVQILHNTFLQFGPQLIQPILK